MAFKAPPIDNHHLVLAKHLGLNINNDSQLNQVKRVSIKNSIHTFRFKGELYKVAHSMYGYAVPENVVVSFNCNLWCVGKPNA